MVKPSGVAFSILALGMRKGEWSKVELAWSIVWESSINAFNTECSNRRLKFCL